MQTKKQFSEYFKANIESDISATDKPALRSAWNDTIDAMIRDRQLPERAGDWSHPIRFYHASERPKRTLKPGLPRLKKGDVLTIIGKRWFDRGPGNTYHSVEIILNGVSLYTEPFAYGYDDAYKQTALKWLVKNYRMPKGFDVERSPMWQLRDYGVTVVSRVSDVTRRKEL